MQLAPLQLLAPVFALGALSWAMGAAGAGRGWRSLGVTVVVLSTVLGGLYALFLGIGTAMDEDPMMAGVVVLAAILGLTLVGVLASARRDPPLPKQTQKKDDDGGEGVRRPKPTPPRRPTPPAPAPGGPGPSAPWEQFDDLRSQWERVPAGTR